MKTERAKIMTERKTDLQALELNDTRDFTDLEAVSAVQLIRLDLDVSSSMATHGPNGKSALEYLTPELDRLIAFLHGVNDRHLELSISTFSGEVREEVSFQTPERVSVPDLQVRETGTNIAAAVESSLQTVTERRAWHESGGTYVYQPTLVLLTDGGNNHPIQYSLKHRLREGLAEERIQFVPVAIGDSVDEAFLRSLTTSETLLHVNSSSLESLSFEELFEAIRDSFGAGASIASHVDDLLEERDSNRVLHD
ncbi:MAG: VWA domain-containing protein [Cyanobacteria bacterium J06648_11]